MRLNKSFRKKNGCFNMIFQYNVYLKFNIEPIKQKKTKKQHTYALFYFFHKNKTTLFDQRELESKEMRKKNNDNNNNN